ncbi:MAG: GTPase Era [bacterium]|nr:MAG: GTPase Era [bacterium]
MTGFRSGFIGILGRPNVGKSTLLNALCGEKLAIISSKPQTTRNRILGVLHRRGSQLVFLDTPGMHELDRALNRYMQGVISSVIQDVDAAVYMVDPTRAHGREDRMALQALPSAAGKPVLLAINKVDRAGERLVRERIDQILAEYEFDGVFSISALKKIGLEPLVERLTELVPEGVPYFPEDMVTDQPLSFSLGEIVREKLFEETQEEIPYATAVVVEDIATREDGLVEVSAVIYVERETQKGIIIGKGGRMLRKVGSAARVEMEEKLCKRVFLDLWVKVKKGWTDREGLLRQLGYR